MRHIKFHIMVFVLLFVSFANMATENNLTINTPKKNAKEQLQTVLNRFKTYQADFTQEVSNSDGNVVQQSAGTIKMARPEQLRWHAMTPDETILVANGTEITYADMFLEQVSIYKQSNLIDNHPMMLLSSNDEEVWNRFLVTAAFEPNNAKYTFIVNHVVHDKNDNEVTLAFINDQLIELRVHDGQGNTNQFHFENIKEDQPLPSDTFTFLAPEHFVIDDQSGS